ncbi:MAG: hypothetical protein AAF598_04310 [Bacteroidota bacterium]
MSAPANDVQAPQDPRLEKIRAILLSPDRSKLEGLKDILEKRHLLKEKVDPIIQEEIEFIQANFPEVFGKQVDKAIEKKISESPELLLSILSPVLGKLIRKGIAQQFQLLRESIDKQIREFFTRQGFFGRLKARLFGISESDLIIAQADGYQYEVKEVYVIQRYSGLLLGGYSAEHTMDQDMIGGMLTAIKSFVEDAIKDEDDESDGDLEMIQYGNYKLVIQNFYNYYIAAVIGGTLTGSDREELADKMASFAQEYIRSIPEHIDSGYTQEVSTALEALFNPNYEDVK